MKRNERRKEKRSFGAGTRKTQSSTLFQSLQKSLPLEERRLVQRCLRDLRKQPDNLWAVENLLRAFCRSGDMVSALHWAKRAVRMNPRETRYRYLQALLYESLGMYSEARKQLEMVVRMARSETLRAEAKMSLDALEDSYLPLIEDLLKVDWSFRVECLRDVRTALHARGFLLSDSRVEWVKYLAEQISTELPPGQKASRA